MKKISAFLLRVACLQLWVLALYAGPAQTTKFIKIDQFGYFPAAKKVAVIADPQTGFNAAEAFNPGTGANQYQVRRFNDDAVVYSGTISTWKSGTTHAQSGDRGWWFDFSSVTTPGSYYIFDLANNVGSYQFDIGDNVYDNVLKHAVRMYYYQRLSYAKSAPYTDAKWTDAAAYDGPNQDRAARSRYAKTDASTARDLHGGWMDAGDINKYTTFAESAVIQLVEAYRINPNAFKDDYNIPESGNGIPDVVDELMYELDFLKRMQDGTGTNGFFLKIGVDNYNEVSPLSTDTRPKYYVPECTSSTLSGAAMFAVAGAAFKANNNNTIASYGNDLIARAEAAWARAKITTGNFTTYQTNCDDGDIKSGDADKDAQGQLESAFIAAVYLYEATGKTEYKTFAESRYTQVQPYSINWWGPYWAPQQLALLRLTNIPGVSSTVANNIRNQKAGMSYLNSITDYNNATDLYRAFMADAQYHWGSNQPKTNCGQGNLDFVTFNINTTNASLYKEIAEQYLHYMHGVNPLTMVMLSNMYSFGAENCVNEIYHTWFNDGTVWDNAITSTKGPAPGYVTGGPNKSYSGTVANITNQPAQKAYKDWNTGYPENSWEITEPAIYSNASYIMLLARLVSGTTTPPPPDTEAPTAPVLSLSNITQNSMTLTWTAATDNVGVTGYEVYQGANLLNGNVTGLTLNVTGLTCNTGYSFSVKAKDAAGNKSVASNIASATTTACPLPDTEAPTAPVLSLSNITQSSIKLTWTAATDNVGVTGYEVYQGASLLNANVTTLSFDAIGLDCNTAYSFTVKAKDAAGNKSAASNIATATTTACPLPTTDIVIYDEALQSGWNDVSTGSTRDYNNTNPVVLGSKSLLVNYAANGLLSLNRSTAVTTTANTLLQFWIRSTGKGTFTCYIQTTDNAAASQVVNISTTPNKWVEVIIDMADLGNPAQIKRVYIKNNSSKANTAYFDNIRLTTVVNSSPLLVKKSMDADIKNVSVDFNVYPNPAGKKIMISYEALASENITLKLLSPTGATIHLQNEKAVAGMNNYTINSSNISSGYYFVQVVSNTGNKVKKLMIRQ